MFFFNCVYSVYTVHHTSITCSAPEERRALFKVCRDSSGNWAGSESLCDRSDIYFSFISLPTCHSGFSGTLPTFPTHYHQPFRETGRCAVYTVCAKLAHTCTYSPLCFPPKGYISPPLPPQKRGERVQTPWSPLRHLLFHLLQVPMQSVLIQATTEPQQSTGNGTTLSRRSVPHE